MMICESNKKIEKVNYEYYDLVLNVYGKVGCFGLENLNELQSKFVDELLKLFNKTREELEEDVSNMVVNMIF